MLCQFNDAKEILKEHKLVFTVNAVTILLYLFPQAALVCFVNSLFILLSYDILIYLTAFYSCIFL